MNFLSEYRSIQAAYSSSSAKNPSALLFRTESFRRVLAFWHVTLTKEIEFVTWEKRNEEINFGFKHFRDYFY